MIERIVAAALVPAWLACATSWAVWVVVHKVCGNDHECAHV